MVTTHKTVVFPVISGIGLNVPHNNARIKSSRSYAAHVVLATRNAQIDGPKLFLKCPPTDKNLKVFSEMATDKTSSISLGG
jgi:hypothetical protein